MASGRVLLTGAAGFIGRATLARLRLHNINYIATDLHPHPEVPELVTGDLREEEFLVGLLQPSRFTTVIHLGAMLPTAARRDPVAATRVNVDASCSLLKVAQSVGVRRFVFGSSLGVYGGRFDHTPVSEETPAAPEEVYGAGKLYVEQIGALLQTEHFAFSALRIATTVGEGVTNSASPWRSQILEVLRAKAPTTVEVPYAEQAILPLVHVSDVGRALMSLAVEEKSMRGIFNSPAESLSVTELRELISSLNPYAKVKAGTRRDTGIPAYMDCQKIFREAGYQPVPLRQHFEHSMKSATSSRQI